MEDAIVKIQDTITLYGLNLIAAVAIFIVGRWVAMAIRSLVRRLLEKSKVDQMLVSFLASVTYVAAMAFVIIAALARIGVQTASFVAVVGAAGLAIGLALQGSLANFAAGVLIVIFRPFRIGDFIEAAGITGVVEEIGIFTTELKTPDNKKVIVPNGKVTADSIVNYSAKEERRIDMVAGVSYSDDLDKVRRILEQIVSEDGRILPDPAPKIAVLELGDSSVNFVVRPWVKTADYWDVYFSIQEKIKKRFDSEGISIPFPQRDVHLYQT